MTSPETRYAKSGDVRIAYQVVGNGPIDLVFVPGYMSNLDLHWEDPGYSHLLLRLSAIELAGGKIKTQTVVQAWDA